MKKHKKQLLALAATALIFGEFGLPAQAQGVLYEQGVALLAPNVVPTGVAGSGYAAYPQEYLTVAYSVYNNAGIFTYDYVVGNPAGDMQLNPNGTFTATPETVDSFEVGFDATAANALLSAPTGGTSGVNSEVTGVTWFFSPSIPSSGHASLSFTSAFAPAMGDAQGLDSAPTSPWTSTGPGGQTVPVPSTVPEPPTIVLFAGILLLLPFRNGLMAANRKKMAAVRA